jgi:hypothetical protein
MLDTPTTVAGVTRKSRLWPFAWNLLVAGFDTWKLQTIMYGKESYVTTNALVSGWRTCPHTAWSGGTAVAG